MSYEKAIRWHKKHVKGTKQPVLMHTNSGFWPSHSFLVGFWAYQERCGVIGVEPMECEAYYKATLNGREVKP
jgi:hypothetical protein